MKRSIVTVFFFMILTVNAFAQVAIIAHKSVPVTKIKKSQLLDFYTGDIRMWSNGEPVLVFDLKRKSETREAFYNFIGKSSSRMKSIWMKRMLSGEGDPPEALASSNEMLKKVASTPGAIGFINQNNLSGDVKVLLLIDKKE